MPHVASPGMRTFSIIWFGQVVSTIGSGLTGFALGVWVYQTTGSTTLFALNLLAFTLPNLLVAPFAGALADRWDRRWVMILSDSGASLSTLAVLLLVLTNHLQVWHIYLLTAWNAAFTTLQWPAYSAATTLLVPKSQLGRAGGMVQIGEALSQLISPALAGAMFMRTGLRGIALVDFATYLFAVFTLLMVRIPKPTTTPEGLASRGSLLNEMFYGWKYITARAGLFGLLCIFAVSNFLASLLNPLMLPMLLEMSTPAVVGYLASILGLGMLAGTLVMSLWGGPRRRIHGVLGYSMLCGLFIALFGLSATIPFMAVVGFALMFTMPIINGSSQALWQSKVATDVQGRVFAVRRMIAMSAIPLAYLCAGPLADNVFRPLLVEGGPLADHLVGRVLGVGPSRGIGLLFVINGLLNILVAGVGYLHLRIRNVEEELPDAVVEPGKAVETASVEVTHSKTKRTDSPSLPAD